jgi:hypothetical protein
VRQHAALHVHKDLVEVDTAGIASAGHQELLIPG